MDADRGENVVSDRFIAMTRPGNRTNDFPH